MKKLIFTALVLTSLQLHAQNVSRSKADAPVRKAKQLHLNPMIGVTSAGFTANSERNLGFTVGALLNMGKSDWVFETGGLFTQQGGSVSGKKLPISMNYAAAPLFAKYTLKGDEGADLHLRAGVIPELLLATSGGSAEISQRFDVLAAGGIGAGFAFNNSIITIDAIYSRGLVRLNATESPLYNQSLTVAGGVLF